MTDDGAKRNRNYIIILEDIDQRQLDALFEHTQLIKAGSHQLHPRRNTRRSTPFRQGMQGVRQPRTLRVF